MTLEQFNQFGNTLGYAYLPETLRRQIVQDIPLWSEFVRQEAERFGCPYFDMSEDFHASLREAETVLLTGTILRE